MLQQPYEPDLEKEPDSSPAGAPDINKPQPKVVQTPETKRRLETIPSPTNQTRVIRLIKLFAFGGILLIAAGILTWFLFFRKDLNNPNSIPGTEPLAQLIQASQPVTVTRTGGGSYSVSTDGYLFEGDKLNSGGAKITLMVNNNSCLVTLEGGSDIVVKQSDLNSRSQNCQPLPLAVAQLITANDQPANSFNTSKGGANLNILPQLLSPVSLSAITDTKPVFRWRYTPQASSYLLSIKELSESNELILLPNIKDTFQVYPSDAPALKPGRTYQAKVIAQVNSNETVESITTFQILSEEQSKDIQAKAAAYASPNCLGSSNLTLQTCNFLKAIFYESQNLSTSALQELQTLLQSNQQNAVYHRTIADIYFKHKLYVEALASYEQVLTTTSDSQTRAAALVGKAKTLYANPQPDKMLVRQTLESAKQLYHQMRDSKSGEAVSKLLADLE